jgi:hypothetical protein
LTLLTSSIFTSSVSIMSKQMVSNIAVCCTVLGQHPSVPRASPVIAGVLWYSTETHWVTRIERNTKGTQRFNEKPCRPFVCASNIKRFCVLTTDLIFVYWRNCACVN